MCDPAVIAKLLEACCSSDVALIKSAEGQLAEAASAPGYLSCLIQVIRQPAIMMMGNTVKQMAAICLKNGIKKRWDLPEAVASSIKEDERIKLRAEVVDLFMSTVGERQVQAQLTACLTEMTQVDSSSDWRDLLATIISSQGITAAATTDPSAMNRRSVAMCVVATVVDKYRNVTEKSDQVLSELKYDVLPQVQKPLLKVFTEALQTLLSTPNNTSTTVPREQCFNIVYHSTKIFLSLISVDLPEFIEDNAPAFFEGFLAVLLRVHSNGNLPSATKSATATAPTPNTVTFDNGAAIATSVEELKAEVFRCMTLYAQRYSEEFQPFVQQCVAAALTTLSDLSASAQQGGYEEEGNDERFQCETLLSAGMRFLGAASKITWSPTPFTPQCVTAICEHIIVPNVRLGPADLELTEENPQEFVRRSLEGGDVETKRGSAVQLVQALNSLHEKVVAETLPRYISSLLSRGSATPTVKDSTEAQCAMDAAIHLTIAVVVKAESRHYGVSQIAPLVNLQDFLTSHLAKEIKVPVGGKPSNVLTRSAALKFVATFRNQFSKSILMEILPEVVNNLQIQNVVVHTHAAYCLECLMLAREAGDSAKAPTRPAAPGMSYLAARYTTPLTLTRTDVRGVLTKALPHLLALLKSNGAARENEYVMRCLLKGLVFLGPEVTLLPNELLLQCIDTIQQVLVRQCESSSNPQFGHYIFEVIGTLVRNIPLAAATQPSSTTALQAMESALLPSLFAIVAKGDHDFMPYGIQILGLLLDATPCEGPLYEQLLTQIMAEPQWTASTARVPAIVRLLSAYFRKYSVFETQLKAQLPIILQRFQYCVNHKRLAMAAIDLLTDLLHYFPPELQRPHQRAILMLLLKRLQGGLPPKETQALCFALVLMSARDISAGPTHPGLAGTLESVQTGLSANFITTVLVPNCKKFIPLYHKRVALLGLASLCRNPIVSQNKTVFYAVVEACASLMGVISAKDTRHQQQQTTNTDPSFDDALAYAEEFQGVYNVLQATRVPTAVKEIPEASADALAANVRQCFSTAPTEQLTASPVWPLIAATLATPAPQSATPRA